MRLTRPRLAPVLIAAGLTGVGIGVAANALGIHPTRVVSSSMAPAIERGDWVVTRDLGESDRHAINRDDIVMFRFPLGTEGRAVKRVIAVGGDEVSIERRRLKVGERTIPIAGAPSEGAARTRVETVSAGHVFLLGDNSANSIDSRSFGAVPETELVARVLVVLPKPRLVALLGLALVLLLIVGGRRVARRR